jgi:hypothetical protein
MAAADRPERGTRGGGADQGGGDDEPPLRGQHIGVGQRAGVGDRLEREQRIDHLGRPAPAGRYVRVGPRVCDGVIDHGDELAQQMGVAQRVGRRR